MERHHLVDICNHLKYSLDAVHFDFAQNILSNRSPPSLYCITVIRIAISMWEHETRWRNIPNYVDVFSKSSMKAHLIQSEEQVLSNISNLVLFNDLPIKLRNDLKIYVKQIGEELLKFLMFIYRIYCGSQFDDIDRIWNLIHFRSVYHRIKRANLNYICWTYQGTVNRLQTANTVIVYSNLGIAEKYIIACNNCLVTTIHNMHAQLSETFLKEVLYCTLEDKLVAYWTMRVQDLSKQQLIERQLRIILELKHQLQLHLQRWQTLQGYAILVSSQMLLQQRQAQIMEQLLKDISGKEYEYENLLNDRSLRQLFQWVTDVENNVAVQYFWNIADREIHSYLEVIATENLISLVFKNHNCLDMLCYLMKQMPEIDGIFQICSVTELIQKGLEDWKWHDVFLPSARFALCFVNSMNLEKALVVLLLWPDSVFEEGQREQLLRQFPIRNRLLLFDAGVVTCHDLMIEGREDILHLFLRTMFSTIDEILKFKGYFWYVKGFISYQYLLLYRTSAEARNYLYMLFTQEEIDEANGVNINLQ